MTTVRSLRAGSPQTLWLLVTLAVAPGARVSAHRLDDFLQAARIAVDRDRVQVQMNLTPGTAVAEGVLRDIDADRNGVLSPEEQQTYAARVVSALTIRVDDSSALGNQLVAASFPDVAALRAGDGAISILSIADMSRLPAGPHRIYFRNRHAAAASVYLANVLVPESEQVAVTGQLRDGDQRELLIEVVINDSSSRQWMWIGWVGALALASPRMRRAGTRLMPRCAGACPRGA